MDAVDADGGGGADEQRIVGDLGEGYVADGEMGGALYQDAVVGVIVGKGDVGRRQADGFFERGAVAIDAEAGEAEIGRAFGVDQGAALEVGGGPERGAGWIASDFQVVGCFGEG